MSGTNSSNSAKAYITKVLQTTKGTTIPEETFTFKVTQKEDDVTTQNVSDAKVSFTSSSTTNPISTSDDSSVYAYGTAEIFKNVNWTAAGEYHYTVTESYTGDSNTNVKTTSSDGVTTTMTYSKASYDVTAYVATDTDGKLYLKYVTATQTVNDEGESVTNTNNSAKVSPTVPTIDETTKTITDGTGGLRFTNTYLKKINNSEITDPTDPIPTDPKTPDAEKVSLAISKKVSGDIADTTGLFKFSVTITTPSIVSDSSYTIKAKIVGTTLDTTNQSSADVTFESGTAKDVYLKPGQSLIFYDLYVGSKVSVSETAALGHTASATATSVKDTTSLNAYTVDSTSAAVTGNVSEGSDYIAYTNTKESNTPTGLLIDNLPYIALIGVTVVGFVAYIAFKRKNAAEE